MKVMLTGEPATLKAASDNINEFLDTKMGFTKGRMRIRLEPRGSDMQLTLIHFEAEPPLTPAESAACVAAFEEETASRAKMILNHALDIATTEALKQLRAMTPEEENAAGEINRFVEKTFNFTPGRMDTQINWPSSHGEDAKVVYLAWPPLTQPIYDAVHVAVVAEGKRFLAEREGASTPKPSTLN